MPEEKYVPNSSVMGGSSVVRKISFFGRDKIGAETPAENTPQKAPDSPAPDSQSDLLTAAPDSSEISVGSSGPDSPTLNLWASLPQAQCPQIGRAHV